MDEGQPIAYEVLESGVPVFSSDGERIGTVAAVLSAPDEDIFHGLLVEAPGQGTRFIEAASIASMHERGVDLRIDAAAAAQLPPPEQAAPIYDEDPANQRRWHHWVHKLTGRTDWDRET